MGQRLECSLTSTGTDFGALRINSELTFSHAWKWLWKLIQPRGSFFANLFTRLFSPRRCYEFTCATQVVDVRPNLHAALKRQ